MLGKSIQDPEGLEGPPGTTPGLDILPVETVLQAPKTTTLSDFDWAGIQGSGYEIHMGATTRISGSAFFKVTTRNQTPCNDFDGCISENNRVAGTYMHGLFDTQPILERWLGMIGISSPGISNLPSREQNYTLLKEHFERHVNLKQIMDVTGITDSRIGNSHL